MSLNVSNRSDFSSESYNNPPIIKYDKKILKNVELYRIPYKKYLKTSSTISENTGGLFSNVLSDERIDNVKQHNLTNLDSFPYNTIPLNIEDFKFSNLKERIKIIEVRNRKNSTQSSKTLNQIGSDNLSDKIDTTLEDSIDRSGSLKFKIRNSYTDTQYPSKQTINNLASESLKNQQKLSSKFKNDSTLKSNESKINFSAIDYTKSTNQPNTEIKNNETKINLPKPPNNFVNTNIINFKIAVKLTRSRPIYRVPKYGPLKLSSQELSPEVYSNKKKSTKFQLSCSKKPIDHPFEPYSIQAPKIELDQGLDNTLNPLSSNTRSLITSSESQNNRHISYPNSNISSISSKSSKSSINIDENDKTALKLRYISRFKEVDNNQASSTPASISDNKLNLQDRMSVIFTDKPKPCLVLSDYSSSSDSDNFNQELPQFLQEMLTFPSLR